MAHPKTLAAAGMGRAAAGVDMPWGFPACTEEPSFRDATESGLANASGDGGDVCTRGEGLAGKQAAPVGVADMWDTGMPPSGCQERGTGGLQHRGSAWGGVENTGFGSRAGGSQQQTFPTLQSGSG